MTKTMTTKWLLAAMLTVGQLSAAFGHALWIETNSQGASGKAHTVKIFYGEYAAKEFENTDKWYSDVSTFVLWLTDPGGAKVQVPYKAAGDHFEASFTPTTDGVYTLTVGHTAKDVDDTYVYQFNASALVRVGKAGAAAQVVDSNDLYLQPVSDPKGKAGIVKVFYKGKPAADITVSVTGSSGWSKNFKTNKDGVLEFEQLWKGSYALEGFYTVDESGVQAEKKYEHIWRCATIVVDFSNLSQTGK